MKNASHQRISLAIAFFLFENNAVQLRTLAYSSGSHELFLTPFRIEYAGGCGPGNESTMRCAAANVVPENGFREIGRRGARKPRFRAIRSGRDVRY
jgi:hypothetical protein